MLEEGGLRREDGGWGDGWDELLCEGTGFAVMDADFYLWFYGGV
jgi:hypothetical protein